MDEGLVYPPPSLRTRGGAYDVFERKFRSAIVRPADLMEFPSALFLLFVVAVVSAYHASQNPAWRIVVLTAANIVFIASYLTTFSEVVPLLGFLIVSYTLVETARSIRSTRIFVFSLSFILASFIYLKRFAFISDLPALPFPYITLGLSYILFRVLHLLIDARDGEVPERISPLAFLNYTCNFLCFVSGPIQRYQQFLANARSAQPGLDEDQVFLALRRIITGYVKVIIVSGFADFFFTKLHRQLFEADALASNVALVPVFALAAILYAIYLYYNFSGYMDIIIGIGKLLRQDLPENFNKPFLARDFLEFWTRWHMTLSEWFKTYLFNPLMQALMTRFRQPALMPYLGVAAFFVTFLVMGLWHGTTAIFAIYGLLMGAGASITRLWQLLIVKLIGKVRYRKLGSNKLYEYLCRGLVCAYYAMGITCFWVDLTEAQTLWQTVGPTGLLAGLVLLTIACAVGFFLWDFTSRAVAGMFDITRSRMQRGVVGHFWAAADLLVVLVVFSFFHKPPEFVYRGF
ncbi:MAG TPA: MBOAT family O-acyltransferase [Stellaceae bacterium]|nr:MBOAT family O-acyltransferase [Stellaceae bacterium]